MIKWGWYIAFLMLFLAGKTYAQDTTQKKIDYILVIPFAPQMYQCDGAHFICKRSDLTPGELSDVLRRSVASTMVNNLSTYYNATELKSNSLLDKNSDLSQMYRIVNYKTKVKKLKSYYKGYPPFKLKEMLAPSHVRWGSDCVNKKSKKPNAKRHKYIKAEVENDSLFEDICRRNKAVYVVMFDQMEINTRFRNCLDLQENIFQRDIFLHYTLFDNTGEYIDGGVVGTTYESGTNNVNVIMEKNLGLLTSLIVEIIRAKI